MKINHRNYCNISSLHLLIGGGNSVELPSLGLDIWRSSVCTKHAGGRFSYALACPLGEECGEMNDNLNL